MGSKYKIKKEDLRSFYATIDMMMDGRYHEFYERLGWKKGSNGNFFCWNTSAHSDKKDAHPSLSVNKQNGTWHCFACSNKGNFQSYWKENLKGGSGGDSFSDFAIDFLGMATDGKFKFSTSSADPDYEKNLAELRTFHDQLQSEKFIQRGKRWVLSSDLADIAKEETTIPMAFQDAAVEALLSDEAGMKYLFDTRRITPEVIKRHRIGMNDKGKFLFPIINVEGSLINVKAYDPRGNPNFKWSYPFKGHESCPTPMDNFTHQKLYFFGGEPDTYCAISMGVQGAVTLGSEAITNVDNVFGMDRARQIFTGKEIVIVLDSDETGVKASVKLADSLYPYAKQVKIINLDVSETNPFGLDPNDVTESGAGDKIKKKRNQKDFTDLMKKGGFEESAITSFYDLERDTPVYTQNIDRVKRKVLKVSVQESRMPYCYSHDGSTILEIIAPVSEFDGRAFMYPTKFQAVCNAMATPKDIEGACKRCSIPKLPEFGKSRSVEFNFVREIPKEHFNDKSYIKIYEHEILGLIEVARPQKELHQKRLCQINENCKVCSILDMQLEKLLHVQLTKDVNEYGEKHDSASAGNVADINMDSYMILKDIYPNKSYKFEAVRTTGWKDQQAVLFIHKAEPVATCTETFTMDQQTHDMLRVFRPKKDETIGDALKRKYDAFSSACGAVGRHDVFFLNDLAFFSPLEINCKILPGISRGWVEVLIAGDTRTCKTMVTKWLRNHYKIGDMIAGSTAVTRSGLLGGMTKSTTSNKMRVEWGKIPMNDGGIVIIDELSNIKDETLFDLTGCRSDGIANITGIVSRQVLARVRKIMLSNQREWKTESEKADIDGMTFIKRLCLKDEVISRFDAALVLRKDDVEIENITSTYEKLTSEYTEYQCQNLIRFNHSRRSDQVEYADGFFEAVNDAFVKMLKKFHSATQLINQELRAKLVRMSISLAGMLYSTVDGDWDKILVTKDHVEYVAWYLDKIYCSKNMGLDRYSERIRMHENLGDMRFMESILKVVDINQLLRYEDFSEKNIQQIFCDYLERVQNKTMYMVDTHDDHRLSTGQRTYESVPKLIGTLTSRNCLERSRKGGYGKTKQFNLWLAKRQTLGKDATFSNLLEGGEDKHDAKVSAAAERFGVASK